VAKKVGRKRVLEKESGIQPKRGLSRIVEGHDLGRRFMAEETFFREVLDLEEKITPKIDEALYNKEFGKVGAHLRTFYLEVCKRLDKAKFETEDTLPKD
jgi:hypothetical protein